MYFDVRDSVLSIQNDSSCVRAYMCVSVTHGRKLYDAMTQFAYHSFFFECVQRKDGVRFHSLIEF